MTNKEAELFFPISSDQLADELYAERLFEYKQFFLTKPPIKKLFDGKLKKLTKMDKAYRLLTNQIEKNDTPKILPEIITLNKIEFSNIISKAFYKWENAKSMIKQQIISSVDAQELKTNAQIYTEIAEKYYKCWYCSENIDVDIDNISKDLDPMLILQQIKLFEAENGYYFSDIIRMKTNTVLLKEMKRLSLLIETYGYEKKNV